jgi:hypothetical protein
MKAVRTFLQESINRVLSRDTLAIVCALTIFALLELLILAPNLWWLLLLLAIVIAVAGGVLLTNFSTPVPGWWHTLFSPALLVSSTVFLVLFLNSSIARHISILASCILLALFWENIRRYYWDLKNYHAESLENVSLGINIFIVWFTSSGFYHVLLDPALVQKYSSLTLPITALLMVAVVYLVDYRTIWVQRYNAQKVWLLLTIQSIIIGEIFWVLNFLPNSIEMKAFIVALVYYYFISLGRVHLDGNLNATVLRRYVYYGSAFLLLVLITSRWLI